MEVKRTPASRFGLSEVSYIVASDSNINWVAKITQLFAVRLREGIGSWQGARGARGDVNIFEGGQFKKARGIGTHRRRQYRLLRNRKGKGATFSGGSYEGLFR